MSLKLKDLNESDIELMKENAFMGPVSWPWFPWEEFFKKYPEKDPHEGFKMLDTFPTDKQPDPKKDERSKSVTDEVLKDLSQFWEEATDDEKSILPAPDVKEDLIRRREGGKKKYGTELMSHNGRDPLVDFYQEMLDAVMYYKQSLMELGRDGDDVYSNLLGTVIATRKALKI